MNRRFLVLGASALALTGCATGSSTAPPLDQVKAYATALIDAVSAAGQEYLASPDAEQTELVATLLHDAQTLKLALAEVVSETDAKSIASEVVSVLGQVLPIVTVFLGPAAPYVPLALAVIQAFILALPTPTTAPPAPPAALTAKAKLYRRN